MNPTYLIRFGLMRQVGRFAADSSCYQRGDTVVVRSGRGTELGEVLMALPAQSFSEPLIADAEPSVPRVLRRAGTEDRARAAWADAERSPRFEACARLFRDGVWPLELIDVEPMLDDRRTVLHYLGPHGLDTSGLRAAVEATCDLDIIFEPVGLDASPHPDPEPSSNCGSCGSGGGCGSDSDKHSCSGCSLQSLLSGRR